MTAGYRLHAHPDYIYAYPATDEQYALLTAIPGAVAYAGRELGHRRVTLPATRENFLSAEVVAPIAEATPQYDTQRAFCLYPGGDRMHVMLQRCCEIDVDPDSLLTHQRYALAQFYDQAEAYLAADQGTGKSRIALILARLWGARRVLIICPKSISSQWEVEHRKIWGKMGHHVLFEHLTHGPLGGRQRVLHDLRPEGFECDDMAYPVYVTVNYEMVASLQEHLLCWAPDVLILDEVWRAKTPTTAVTKALMGLTKMWRSDDTLRGVIALAGTPWGNHAGDIWSQLRIVAPESVPESYSEFLQKHTKLEVHQVARGRTVVKPVGLLDPVGLIRRLDPIWFRASKETCLDLPPKTRCRVELNLPPVTRNLYRAVQKDGLAALGDDLALDGAREVAVRLHQIAGGHRPTRRDDGEWVPVPIDSCSKIAWLHEFAEDVLAPDPTARVLVWCQYRCEICRVTCALQRVLGMRKVVACYGGTLDEELERAKESYQSRDPEGVQVLVCQWQRMAAGNDLPATSHSIVFSPTWSHILADQAEDRGHRIGNTTGVQVIELCAKTTIDEAVYAALARKADFSGQLLIETVGSK